MTRSSFPTRPERWLRSVLGDTPRSATIVGDLREEYAHRPPGLRRSISYGCACASIALRYVPSTLFDALTVETRQVARGLLRSPTYTIASVLTLALGIAICATLLTLTYGSLLRPLPYPAAGDLVRWGQSPLTGRGADSINSLAAANLRDLSPGLQQFTGLAGYSYRRVTLTGTGNAQGLLMASVTGNFFEVLGARPLIGRTFVADDDRAGAVPTVILAERLWRSEFASAPNIIGATVTLDTVPHVVIGVMPKHLPWPGNPQAWSTMRWTGEQAGVRNRRAIEGVARLRPGATLAVATSELKARFAQLALTYPTENGQSTVSLRPLKEAMIGAAGPNSSLLPLLAGLASVMLCVAYLNLATLSIGRREARGHEIALRKVLGASGWRQRLSHWMEASMVAVAGAAGGALLAAWTLPIVLARYGTSIARADTIAFDLSTIVVIIASAAGAAALMAITGTDRSKRTATDLNRRSATGVGRVRRMLVSAQVGLAGGLVYGAVLIGWMIASLARVDLGVPLEHGLTFAVGIPAERYDSPARIQGFFSRLEERVRTIPGVTATGATSRTPFFGGTNGAVANAEDRTRSVPLAEWRSVTPEFFNAIGLSLMHGRSFAGDAAGEARTAIISQSLSEALFGTPQGAGRRIVLEEGPPCTVIGVVSDIRDFGPIRPGRPTVYLRHASETGFTSMTDMTMVVRSAGETSGLLTQLREAVAAIDSNVPIRAVASLEEIAMRSIGTNRTTAGSVLLILAGVALALGTIGVFGVTAVSVERRTREIGVRLALGETPAGILGLVLRDGLSLTLAGCVLGGVTSALVYGLVKSFIVTDRAPGQAAVIVLSIGVLVVASFIATIIPARRAAALSPVEAIRSE